MEKTTYLFVFVLLAASGAGYVYNQHPELLPKEWQPVLAKPVAPDPVVVTVASVATPPPALPMPIATPSPAPAVSETPTPKPEKHWHHPDPATVYPSDWTLADGTTYHKVKVISVDPDAVSIMHADGVSLVDCVNLSPELQKLVDYDPYFAVPAAAKRAAQEQMDGQAALADADRNATLQQTEMAQITSAQNQIQASEKAQKIQALERQIADLQTKASQADAEARGQNHGGTIDAQGRVQSVSQSSNGDYFRMEIATLQQQLAALR